MKVTLFSKGKIEIEVDIDCSVVPLMQQLESRFLKTKTLPRYDKAPETLIIAVDTIEAIRGYDE